MTEQEWVEVDEVSGDVMAEILGGLLEAQGIRVWLNQEGAGRVYGLTIPSMGAVHIMVPASQVEEASQTLEAYYQGQLEAEAVPPDSGEEFREDDVELSEESPEDMEDDEEEDEEEEAG